MLSDAVCQISRIFEYKLYSRGLENVTLIFLLLKKKILLKILFIRYIKQTFKQREFNFIPFFLNLQKYAYFFDFMLIFNSLHTAVIKLKRINNAFP